MFEMTPEGRNRVDRNDRNDAVRQTVSEFGSVRQRHTDVFHQCDAALQSNVLCCFTVVMVH